jgi:hypothetical protein
MPLSSFRAYRLGHFDIKTLFLLRSYYKTLQHDRAVVNQARSQEPSKDHQGQVSVTATRQSLTVILDPHIVHLRTVCISTKLVALVLLTPLLKT